MGYRLSGSDPRWQSHLREEHLLGSNCAEAPRHWAFRVPLKGLGFRVYVHNKMLGLLSGNWGVHAEHLLSIGDCLP